MEPKVLERKEIKVVGLNYFGDNKKGEIPSLWGVFNKRYSEIESKLNPEICYGLCESEITQNGEINYTTCCEVSDFSNIPEGMITKLVPAGKYLVFTFKDEISKIGAFYEYIYKEFMPSSSYELEKRPDFEYYDSRFCDNGELDIYIPIK